MALAFVAVFQAFAWAWPDRGRDS